MEDKMYYETSFYIRNDLLLRLDNGAERLNISRSKLVSTLLVSYMKNNQAGDKAFKKLKYQERDRNEVFETKSLCLRPDIYEFWCNVRLAFKISASLLIALAIDLYLEEILNGKKPSYNYFSMYITNTTYHNNVYINTTVWGYPGEEQMKKLSELTET